MLTPRPTLELRAVTHGYGRPTPVLAGVSEKFWSGQLTALWGPSGSGKSTVLSLLGLLMPPESGEVIVDGSDAWSSRRSAADLRRRRFGWVLQNLASLESRTAIENVRVGLFSRGFREAAATRIAASALTTVGLGHRLDAKAKDLSGGEVQRMTIARMICQDTPVLLADEPTGQLDRASSIDVAETLGRLAVAGRCVVVATHDEMVASLCSRVLEVADGRIRGRA